MRLIHVALSFIFWSILCNVAKLYMLVTSRTS